MPPTTCHSVESQWTPHRLHSAPSGYQPSRRGCRTQCVSMSGTPGSAVCSQSATSQRSLQPSASEAAGACHSKGKEGTGISNKDSKHWSLQLIGTLVTCAKPLIPLSWTSTVHPCEADSFPDAGSFPSPPLSALQSQLLSGSHEHISSLAAQDSAAPQ